MKSRLSNVPGRHLAVLVLAGLLVTTTASDPVVASGDVLTGAWSVQVTLRDCTTGAPIGPPINSLVTFHEGGTLSETAGGLGFAIGQRSPGHGIWSAEGPAHLPSEIHCAPEFRHAGEPPWHTQLRSHETRVPRLLRRLADGDPHARARRRQSCHVGRHECVLQDGRYGVSDRVLDRRCRTLQVSLMSGCRRSERRHPSSAFLSSVTDDAESLNSARRATS